MNDFYDELGREIEKFVYYVERCIRLQRDTNVFFAASAPATICFELFSLDLSMDLSPRATGLLSYIHTSL